MSQIIIAITGPECSGKSTLAKALAAHFGGVWVPEYARTYLAHSGGSYTYADLDAICAGQMQAETEAVASGAPAVICDTDATVLYIWSLFRFGKVSPAIEARAAEPRYHHYLLCKPDLPWVADPFRESPNPEERMALFRMYEQKLLAALAPYTVIQGKEDERLARAIATTGAVLGGTGLK
jgi:NadR type nicotinamide-nucleotide adenylyltransferase